MDDSVDTFDRFVKCTRCSDVWYIHKGQLAGVDIRLKEAGEEFGFGVRPNGSFYTEAGLKKSAQNVITDEASGTGQEDVCRSSESRHVWIVTEKVCSKLGMYLATPCAVALLYIWISCVHVPPASCDANTRRIACVMNKILLIGHLEV